MSPLTIACTLIPLLTAPPDSAPAHRGHSPAQARLLTQRAHDVHSMRDAAARAAGHRRPALRDGVIRSQYTIRGPHVRGTTTVVRTTTPHGIWLDADEMDAIAALQAELLATRAALDRAHERIRALEDFIAAHAADLPPADDLPPEFEAARDLLE